MKAAQAPTTVARKRIVMLRTEQQERLRRRVRTWARGFLGLTDGEFDDAYQTAWLRVMEHLTADRHIRNLEHFLRWEVANSWRMELRRRKRHPTVRLEMCPEERLGSGLAPDAAAHMERIENARLLLELIGSMEATRRQVLLLRNAWGLSPGEVCRLLGISRRTYREEHAGAFKEIHAKAAQVI